MKERKTHHLILILERKKAPTVISTYSHHLIRIPTTEF